MKHGFSLTLRQNNTSYMETIKLPKADLEEMRQFYEAELNNTLKRLQHIKNILDNIGGKGQSVQIQIDLTNKETHRPVTTEKKPVQTRTRKKKRGPKSLWENLIIKRLKHFGKPMTYTGLTNEIMAFGKIPEEKRGSTKQSIVNVVSRLRRQNVKLNTFSAGTREKYVALKQWFDTNGEIKEQYRLQPMEKQTPKPEKQALQKTGKSKDSPAWTKFVMELLKTENKPLPVKTITLKAMDKFGIDKKMYGKTRIAIAACLTQLDKKNNKVNRHVPEGARSGHYGLSDWFEPSGELKKKYLDKIPELSN